MDCSKRACNCTDEVWRNCLVGSLSSFRLSKGGSIQCLCDFTASMHANLTQDMQECLTTVNLSWLMPWYWLGLIWMPMANLLNGRLKTLWETRLRQKAIFLSLLDAWWMNTLIKRCPQRLPSREELAAYEAEPSRRLGTQISSCFVKINTWKHWKFSSVFL